MANTIQNGRGLTVNARNESALVVEQFLMSNYRFRRNQLSGKVEFVSLAAETDESSEKDFRPLTQEALNSIIIRAKREDVLEKGTPKQDIVEYVHSEEVPVFNPIQHYLEHLPRWNGQNHVAKLFSRLPGISTEQSGFLTVWLRSAVAHWLQMDVMHGNECVPVLIGPQGCGKTTFLRMLLPPQFRGYYLDHLNLSNKFDKEMALTNNLLVNLDELEAIRPSQQSELKQTISKNKVNGRPIFGSVQEDRPRFASFVATTNNPHPLQDSTGSRRYICVTIPKNQQIANSDDIDYEQLYAQVLYELRELKTPYWFNHEEVERIQQLNLEYMQQKDIAEMVVSCFRKPDEGEQAKCINSTEILQIIQNEYPSVKITHSATVHVGFALKEMGFERHERGGVAYYKAIPRKVA